MTELGNVCNLHCNICPREYEYRKQMDIGVMPLDKAKNILDQMIEQMRSGTNFTEITKKIYQTTVLKHKRSENCGKRTYHTSSAIIA